MQTKQTKKLFEEWYADYLKEEINPLEKIYLNKLSIKEGKAYVKQEREKLNKAFLAGLSEDTNLSQEKALPKIIPIETLTDKEIVARIKNPKQEVKTTMGQLFKIQDDARQDERAIMTNDVIAYTSDDVKKSVMSALPSMFLSAVNKREEQIKQAERSRIKKIIENIDREMYIESKEERYLASIIRATILSKIDEVEA